MIRYRNKHSAARRATIAGFTLVEVMLVVVLLLILLGLALPAYTNQVQSSQRSVAAAALMSTMARQQQFFSRHGHFADDLTQLGYPSSPYAITVEGREAESGVEDGIYQIELATAETGYLLLAAPQLGQGSDLYCGTLSLTSLGIKGVSGRGEVARCW